MNIRVKYIINMKYTFNLQLLPLKRTLFNIRVLFSYQAKNKKGLSSYIHIFVPCIHYLCTTAYLINCHTTEWLKGDFMNYSFNKSDKLIPFKKNYGCSKTACRDPCSSIPIKKSKSYIVDFDFFIGISLVFGCECWLGVWGLAPRNLT